MAHSKQMPQDALASIAEQVGERIADVAPEIMQVSYDGGAAPLRLGESFELWLLGADDVESSGRWPDLAKLATPTGRTHHQIKLDQRGMGFARSLKSDDGSEDYSVRELFVSQLAGEIDRAIDWIDRHEDELRGDPLVRLLFAPAYQVYAFWLYEQQSGESSVLLVSSPPQFFDLGREQLLDGVEFIMSLRANKPIAGVSGSAQNSSGSTPARA